MCERWRWVPGYEDLYEVSDHGQVRSVDRFVDFPGGKIKFPGKLLKATNTDRRNPKPAVVLSKNGVVKYTLIDNLVMQAFVGPCPPGHKICHNDGNYANNHWRNLRYDTAENLIADRVKHGLILLGSKNQATKLTEPQVKEIKTLLAQRRSRADIAEQFKVSKSTIDNIAQEKSWKHVQPQ